MFLRALLTTTLLTFSTSVYSVGIMTQKHLASSFANSKFCRELSVEGKNDFILGVWFPYVWYVAEDRQAPEGYDQRIGINDVLESIANPFEMGVKFHYFINQQEREFFKDQPLYDGLSDKNQWASHIIMNITEDMILYTDREAKECRGLIDDHLNHAIDYSKGAFGFEGLDIVRYYFALYVYFTKHPSECFKSFRSRGSYEGISLNVYLDDDLFNLLKYEIPKISSNRKSMSLVDEFIVKLKLSWFH